MMSETTIGMLKSKCKHLLHCMLLISVILAFEIPTVGRSFTWRSFFTVNSLPDYGLPAIIALYSLRIISFLSLPQALFNFYGLVSYNAFREMVPLNDSLSLAPFIAIRVVTRGDYADLVKANVMRNMNLCLDIGLERFRVEVVTDKPINLRKLERIRELVVPAGYRTKSGALFKARALQYCLEDSVNTLNDNDWIVHLDEETLLTENSVRGIVNFVTDGKHAFGQGLITYANENVVNWITTVADFFRVSDDMGKLRLQLKLFHKPLFSWKGSFVVTQVKAERLVSFDNGKDGSIAEDCFFAMRAFAEGYTFDFIEGAMFEKSPFTLMDYLRQRKRWLQGIQLVVHSAAIPCRFKILLAMSLYAWVTLPLTTVSFAIAPFFPLPCPFIVDFLSAFLAAMNAYMYIFGALKSVSVYNVRPVQGVACVIGAVLAIPVNLVIENVAVVWGLFGEKHKFYVVDKNLPSTTAV